jgi:hypothetical protein
MSSQASYTREICLVDGCNNLQEKWVKNRTGDGKQTYRLICTTHRKLPVTFKRKRCENISCKWNGKFESYILEVDHVDGDKTNVLESNFKTLCANCHGIKSFDKGNQISSDKKEKLSRRMDTSKGKKKCMNENCSNVRDLKQTIGGTPYYHNYCRTCIKLRRFGYSKKNYCESTSCQWSGKFESYILEVDHVDGNRKNNVATNFQTICGICHRVKTNQERMKKS